MDQQPFYTRTVTNPIMENGWSGKIRSGKEETGLQSFPPQGMTQVGIQFKDKCDNARTLSNPRHGIRRGKNGELARRVPSPQYWLRALREDTCRVSRRCFGLPLRVSDCEHW